MDHSHTHRVQSHQAENDPVETLCLDHPPDKKANPLFLSTEVRGAIVLTALQASSGER